ncbi:restriction endonuclease subunit S [Aestuariibaculum sp. YM273]|uniref:restriction endonuclease subunit S n=1 Tax=Aestuariibaculum sp. YM273 TaxID=3070659 RepID=UPI0027DDDCEB|nr:restriction endonuclease subunit S [Aestuariibaculum sp. YM273]WMI65527.1 restriction endonuclease subunit S [Aestuariibaculum sp. YM273]
MKKYDSYKDSGIDFIGNIPSDWDRVRIKSLVSSKVTDGPHETPEWKEEGIPFISAEAIKESGINLDYKRGFISQEQHLEYCKKSKVYKGDILFCKSGSTTGKSAFVTTDVEFGIWSPLAIIRADKGKVDNRYLFQFIQSSVFRSQVETGWTFGTQPNIGMGTLENLWISLPTSLEIQTQIANYLDYKTTKIDDLITKKENLIELLKEERTAIINQAVTKGLDPNVPMKDSGIEWLGEIPEHWIEARIKNVVTIIGRIGFRGYTTADLVDEGDGAISLSPSNIKNQKLVLENCTYLSWEKYEESPEIKIYPDDVILVKTGSTIGKTAIITENTPEMTLNPQLVVMKEIKLLPKFLYFLMTSNYFQGYFKVYTAGGSTPAISQEKINNFKIAYPSWDEQQKIVDLLEKTESRIENLSIKLNKEIELLKEYKTALISEVVTGKVDVRDEIIKN